MQIIISNWQLVLILVVIGSLMVFFVWLFYHKPFSRLSSRWLVRVPKVRVQVAEDNAEFLEELSKKIKCFSHEEKILVLQMIFGHDVRVISGLNKDGETWIDYCSSYPYNELTGFGGGEE